MLWGLQGTMRFPRQAPSSRYCQPLHADSQVITDVFFDFNSVTDFTLADDGVKLMTKADRAGERVNTGIAFVRFKDADEAALAAAAQHRKMMGNRYIECIPYTAPAVSIKRYSGCPMAMSDSSDPDSMRNTVSKYLDRCSFF